jgi:hypothetical protein
MSRVIMQLFCALGFVKVVALGATHAIVRRLILAVEPRFERLGFCTRLQAARKSERDHGRP